MSRIHGVLSFDLHTIGFAPVICNCVCLIVRISAVAAIADRRGAAA